MGEVKKLNAANLLSLFRIVIIPIVVVLLIDPGKKASIAASALFLIASLTDTIDGIVARKMELVTDLGKFLDPLADKLLISSALIMLVAAQRIPAWIVAIIVAREIGVTALRGMASSEGVVIAASMVGKVKTTLQVAGTFCLTLHYTFFGIDFHFAGMILIVVALVLTAWSGLDYFVKFLREIF
ncbi:MAG: CDP-diacylglycerol--glycerol-3-phosphate 3-phosphatidyltransferase [Deltaproteobacteria bacterium]|nr:CDP-diacylglycerol--glycerol-3-phosphate 3-phosphatidyltransferase [Deltaproteobacteria bacterium]NIS76555.1 CDP-diacylglycerol--glycerol-3-phosphate 3-phosphatidyltransferase [Deltaproteobacteria bacterium]